MNKLYLAAIAIIIILMGGTYAVVGGAIMGDDDVNKLAMAGAAVIAVVSLFSVLKYVNQMKNDTASGELADENWDGIGEYKNPLPMGWAAAFGISTIWAIWYMLAGYPVGSYSQIGEYNEDSKVISDKLHAKYAEFTDTQKLQMGAGIFSVQCAPCHGPNGSGQEDYQNNRLRAENLNVRKFDEAYVMKVMVEGSTQLGYPGGMMQMELMGLTDEAQLKATAAYVAGGLKGDAPEAFTNVCSGCHGMNGEGMAEVAPSLTAYNEDLVTKILSAGGKKAQIGVMPQFKEMLTTEQIDALSKFVAHGPDKEVE